jgi:hypothetical protein
MKGTRLVNQPVPHNLVKVDSLGSEREADPPIMRLCPELCLFWIESCSGTGLCLHRHQDTWMRQCYS